MLGRKKIFLKKMEKTLDKTADIGYTNRAVSDTQTVIRV